MNLPELELAPKRGQYDRGLSRRDRQEAQRERVVAALGALSASQRDLSIANVVELAGIGRNTFYEYFDDIEHALSAINARVLRDLATRADADLDAVRTPLERVRALARAWTACLFENRTLAMLALRPQPANVSAEQHSALAQYIAVRLIGDLIARSALPGLNDPLKANAVAAIFDSVSRARLRSNESTADELHVLLTELSLRLLR